jgi:4-amino-4-deoxy-L-arabinose transferase-like glycosyltransferase
MNRKEIKIFLVFFILYSYFVFWPGANEYSRFSLTRAIVDEGKLNIDKYYHQTLDRAYYKGHHYSNKAPGTSFLAIPTYIIWKAIYYNFFPVDFRKRNEGNYEYVSSGLLISEVNGKRIIAYEFDRVNPGFFILYSLIFVTIFTSSLFGALSVLLMYKISRYFLEEERDKLLLTLIYGLGTSVFPYSLIFNGTVASAFFVFLSFYLLFKKKKEGKDDKLIFLAGVSLGFAVTTSYIIIPTIPFFLWFALTIKTEDKSKCVGLFLLGLVIGVSPLLLRNYLIFHNPIELMRPHPMEKGQVGDLRKNFGLIYGIKPFVVMRMLFYPYRGLFYYYPILLFSLYGLYKMYKNGYRLEVISIIFPFAIAIITLSGLFNWWGGAVFGPRYQSLFIPLLTLPLVYVIRSLKRSKLLKGIFLFVMLLSVFHNFLGIQNPEHVVQESHQAETAPKYKAIEDTFQVMYNPLYQHYLPLFLKYGPRSRIFENLVNGHLDIDIRAYPRLRRKENPNFPFDEAYTPFLSLVPILPLLVLIWYGIQHNPKRKV